MTDAAEERAALETEVQSLLEHLEAVDPDQLATAVSDTASQRLLTLAVKAYASKLEDENPLFPFIDEESLTATEVGMTVGHMIKAADIDLFELVSWQALRGN